VKIDDVKVIACAYNGRQLIDLVLSAKPDLVITDIKMLKVSGVQAAKYIRKRDQRVQIAFLTAFDDAVEIYALDYLLKPVDKKRLYKIFEHAKMNQQRDTRGQIINFSTDGGEAYIGANEIVFVEAQCKRINRSSFEIVFSVTDNTALLSNSYSEEFRSRIIEIMKLPKWANMERVFERCHSTKVEKERGKILILL